MEVTQENIDEVVKVLRMGKMNDALMKVQDLEEVAKNLIVKYPDLTPDEIGQKYEEEISKQSDQENNSNKIVNEDRVDD